jgi:zinc protease
MRYLLHIAILAVAAPVAAQPAAPAGKAPVPAPARTGKSPGRAAQLPSIERVQLENGLEVAFMALDAAPVASVQLWYRAGSKDEPRDRRGSAHMFEHIMFKGTRYVRAEAHAQFINGLGGYVNAATDEDATHYINLLPSDYIDFAMQLEAERMRNLLFRKEMIAIEREVVKEEIRQQENNPALKGVLRFLEIAYTKHPYAWTAGGYLKDLDATSVDDLKRFYDAYYQPNNAMLVVVGKATLEQVRAAAEKHFGKIPRGPEAPRPANDAAEPPQTSKRREVVEPGQIGLTFMGWHVPAATHKDVYALQVASIILGAGESSRLKVRLKKVDPKTQRSLALDGGVETLIREHPGMVVAIAAYLEKAKIEPVEAALADEVAKLAKSGPTADELRKAKNQVQSGFVFSLEEANGLATAIGRSWIQTSDPTYFLRNVDEIEKVTAADVRRVVSTYFAPDKATVVVIPPRN